jgi:hypothetical protein
VSENNDRLQRPLKTTVSLPPEAVAVLRELSETRNVSFAEVIRRALHIEKYLEDARRSGGKLLIEQPDKSARELVIF